MIAGSLANIIDRIIYSGVIDFIAFHVGPYHWPIFNLADCAIVVGVLIMFVQQIVFPRQEVIVDA